MRWVLVLLVVGCGVEHRVKKLSDVEFQHYYALKPFMEEAQRAAFLKMKTEEARSAYLKELGLWDRFYKYEDHIRKAIVDGAVQTGWTKDMVLMSWGPPFDKRKLTGRPAPRSELLVYKFEKHEDGSVLVYIPGSKTEYKAVDRFMREVYLDSDVVVEIIEKEGWSN